MFLIALTVPGNPYPVTEPPSDDNPTSLRGQACQAGYQSHYLEATQRGRPSANIGDIFGDELLFEGSQTLPLFLVYTTQYGKSGGGGDEQDDKGARPKGWSFLNQSIAKVDNVGAGDESSSQSMLVTSKFERTKRLFFQTLFFFFTNRSLDEIAGRTDL